MVAARPEYHVGDLVPNDRTGTVLTCSLHLFCAISGAGVLAYPNALAWLGWVAGPLLILLVYAITLLMMRLLASCYRVNGMEHERYHHCVSHILGSKQAFLCSLFQITTLILADIALTITGATTAQDLALRAAGVDSGTAWYTKVWVMVLFFGAVELFLSQVRNLEEAWWVSAIGSLCTIISLAIVLIISGINVNGSAKGSVHGIQALPSTTDPGVDVPISTAKKAFGVLNALGMIAFGYCGSQVLLEIQHTLGQPPQPVASMKEACNIAITMAGMLYLAVGCVGYAAFGNHTQGLILQSLPNPDWAIILADAAVILHVIMAFQIFSQAMFDTLESHIKVVMIKRSAKHSTKAVHAPNYHHHAPHHAPHHTLATIPSSGLEEGEDDKESANAPAVAAAEEANLGQSPIADVSPDLGAKSSQPWGDHVLGYRRISSLPTKLKLSSHAHHLSTTFNTAARLEPVQSMALQAGLSVRFTRARTLDTNASTLNTAKSSGFVTFASTMSRAMYRLDTGLACEDVPMNDEGIFVPFWIRVLVRSAYVGLITLIAAIMPFFSAFAGLVGAIIYFPLVVHFPIKLYKKVYDVSKAQSIVLSTIYWVFLGICLASVVGAVDSLISSWSTFQFFQ